MKHLSDELLIHAYKKALVMDLDGDFISLLEEELERRKLWHRVGHSAEN
ncbi:sporulation histidine kinase inhibitor Sda [Virgibacillus sediminis]|uniref:Sporulation histidine kinase inhibitor Sda n=1 Tax=Virgibacillus sediminis TaxID=202260 RepID=A0ABV7A3W4_9BACI